MRSSDFLVLAVVIIVLLNVLGCQRRGSTLRDTYFFTDYIDIFNLIRIKASLVIDVELRLSTEPVPRDLFLLVEQLVGLISVQGLLGLFRFFFFCPLRP